MQLLSHIFYTFLLAGFLNHGVLADVSDAEQNLYAINSALGVIAQYLEALPPHSVSLEAGLVLNIALVVYPLSFLTFPVDVPFLNS
jgi:hypothetical protein